MSFGDDARVELSSPVRRKSAQPEPLSEERARFERRDGFFSGLLVGWFAGSFLGIAVLLATSR